MKNIETRFVVVGTSALKPTHRDVPAQKGIVIEFPCKQQASTPKHAVLKNKPSEDAIQPLRWSLMQFDLARYFRAGSVQGKSFNRVSRLQAASTGIFIGACAFVTIFFGI